MICVTNLTAGLQRERGRERDNWERIEERDCQCARWCPQWGGRGGLKWKADPALGELWPKRGDFSNFFNKLDLDVLLLGEIIDKIVFLLYTSNHYFEGANWSRNLLRGAQWPPLTKVDDQLNMLEVKKDIFKRRKQSPTYLKDSST